MSQLVNADSCAVDRNIYYYDYYNQDERDLLGTMGSSLRYFFVCLLMS